MPILPKCECGDGRQRHDAEGCVTCAKMGRKPCLKYRPRRPKVKARKPIRARKVDPSKRRWAKHRNKAFTDWVSEHDCCMAGFTYVENGRPCWHPEELRRAGKFSDPAHVGKKRATGADDEGEVVNLCRSHHREQEGQTAAFNAKYGVDLKAIAAKLWVRYEREVLGKVL